ncbi:MAG TPA: hypothetical protein VMT23_00390 [Candidatus Binatia bacterium]|nr:hypothetical protein [Candidatus Binatia bacterium]
MATLEQLPINEARSESYGVSYTARLLVSSFFFSQGKQPAQDKIWAYMAKKFGANFDQDEIWQAVGPAAKAAFAIRSNERLHQAVIRDGVQEDTTFEQAKNSVTKQAEKLIAFLESADDGSDKPGGIEELTESLIYVDAYHLGPHVNSGGRRRQRSDRVQTYSDGHLSQWVYFGIMGQSTGMPEYDAMFEDMVTSYRLTGVDDRTLALKTVQLIEYQLHYHQDQAELLPDWAKVLTWAPSYQKF